ncbi:hypothetical protein [Dethiosulfatarculus sandiegensis]|uniref:Uncharacterized protein n=1 Tax=Dethiosulfatarculus sandiegensis TaxID=1429043 RepID=A0A0D2J802_9BACT|nr:hypothetical protein [Dethiosulfatarculus sandiegensis]KIX11846.1 hypothetical protein X474_22175 [Dethiosulfatarculus sandiegensis]
MPVSTILTRFRFNHSSLIFFTFFLLFSISEVVPLQAQELIATPINDNFTESFDKASPVSGIPLAGITIGKKQGHVDVSQIRIAAPIVSDRITCIIARTRDGRYYSENPYHVPSITKNARTARLNPVTKKYGKFLSQYSANDFTIIGRLVVGNNCESAAEFYLPRVSDPKSSDLILYVNSGIGSSYVTATLLPNRDVVGIFKDSKVCNFRCKMLPDDANIAFDTECILDISHIPSKIYSIELQLDDGIEAFTYNYRIFIPTLHRAKQ